MTLQGAVAKGPFILGTNVSVSPVDASGNTTGTQFTTQTTDNAGDFSVMFTYSGPVMLSASGYYYNEMAGALSTSTLTLNGMAAITSSGSQNAYINMLSDIAFGRVKNLMGGGATLAAAVTQADTELYGQLTIAGPSFTPGADATQLNLLGGNNVPAAYLFSASAVVEEAAALSNISGGTDAKVQSMINTLEADFSTAGTFTSSDNTGLQSAVVCVEPDSVMASLQSRFTSISSSAVVPNINLALDSDGDGVVNATDTCVLIANTNQATIPNGVCNYQFTQPPAIPTDGGSMGGECFIQSNGLPTLIADFDTANGNDMLVASPSTCNDLYLWLNNGTGTFSTPTAIGLASLLGATATGDTVQISLLQVADMNNDGKPDLFLAYYVGTGGPPGSPQVAYLPGDGAGHFGSPVTVYAGCLPNNTSCTSSPQCCSGTCQAGPNMCSGTTNTNPYPYASVAVTDLNGDHIPDVAGLGGGSGSYTVSVILSGGGTWAAPVKYALPASVTSATGIAAADFRSNTDVDLAVSTNGAGIYFMPGSGTGAYSAPTTAFTGLGTAVLSVTVLDVDVDGHPDIVATTGTGPYALQIQWGDGTLTPAPTPYTVNTTPVASNCANAYPGGCGPSGCAIPLSFGDVTGDGKPDLVSGYSNAIAINNGNRTIGQPLLVWQGGNNQSHTAGGAQADPLADMNGDGKADLMILGSPPTVVLTNQANHFTW